MSFMTDNFGALANEGIRLMRHHTYLYCSPTRCVFSRLARARARGAALGLTRGVAMRRRSFLSGRFPVHITGMQAPQCSNYLPLKFTLLPAKLKQAGCASCCSVFSVCPPSRTAHSGGAQTRRTWWARATWAT